MLLCPCDLDELDRVLEQSDIPVTLIDRVSGSYDYVTGNHFRGGEILAGYAINCGVRTVALLESDTDNNCTQSRRKGFLDLLSDQNVEISWRKHVDPEDEFFELPALEGVDLVVCTNDRLAIRAREICRPAFAKPRHRMRARP